MYGYDAILIARAEHDEMIRSLPPVPEHGEAVQAKESRWLSRQGERLFTVLGTGLIALGRALKHGRGRALQASRTGQEQIGIPD